jgi:hypothetical protein
MSDIEATRLRAANLLRQRRELTRDLRRARREERVAVQAFGYDSYRRGPGINDDARRLLWAAVHRKIAETVHLTTAFERNGRELIAFAKCPSAAAPPRLQLVVSNQ